MPDQMERLGNSLIQHGPLGHRIYVMEVDPGDMPDLVDRLGDLARSRQYSKIFVNSPPELAQAFLERGYEAEALIPGTRTGPGASFLGLYLDPERRVNREQEQIDAVLSLAGRPPTGGKAGAQGSLEVGVARHQDLPDLAALYGQVFESYPFPIHDPGFLKECLETGATRFYLLRDGEELVAASSAEFHKCGAEMTDFATRQDRQGRGLAGLLLARMVRDMTAEGIPTVYTIARALSPGMNRLFARSGFIHAGTLVNNTNIGGRIESMNVWYRHLG